MKKIQFVVIKKKSGFIGLAFTENGLVANTNPKADKSLAETSLKTLIKGKSVTWFEANPNEAPSSIKEVAEYIDKLWRGEKPESFPKVTIDWSFVTAKERVILETLLELPRDSVISYGQLAEKAGLTRSHARFVGNVMANNPLPILIPCHLVVKSDGSIGNYGYGSKKKEELISLETTA